MSPTSLPARASALPVAIATILSVLAGPAAAAEPAAAERPAWAIVERVGAVRAQPLLSSAKLGLETVGEGVEEASDLERLRAPGCTLAQGYHIARPMPPDPCRWRSRRPGSGSLGRAVPAQLRG